MVGGDCEFWATLNIERALVNGIQNGQAIQLNCCIVSLSGSEGLGATSDKSKSAIYVITHGISKAM